MKFNLKDFPKYTSFQESYSDETEITKLEEYRRAVYAWKLGFEKELREKSKNLPASDCYREIFLIKEILGEA